MSETPKAKVFAGGFVSPAEPSSGPKSFTSPADLSTYLKVDLPEGQKPTNPKDACGVLKAPLSYISMPVLYEVGLGMLEGGYKYGRHNYRTIGVRASIYFDATMRHLAAWWEGEDYDPDSAARLHHISKAIASLTVMRDAILNSQWEDDRPPKPTAGWMNMFNDQVKRLNEQYPDPKPPHTEKGK